MIVLQAVDRDLGLHGSIRYSFLPDSGRIDYKLLRIDSITGKVNTTNRDEDLEHL